MDYVIERWIGYFVDTTTTKSLTRKAEFNGMTGDHCDNMYKNNGRNYENCMVPVVRTKQ